MAHFKRTFKYNIKEELICYKKKLDSLNILIKAAIKANNRLYKLAIKIYYSRANNKVRLYFEYISYYNKLI